MCWANFKKKICCESGALYPTPYKFDFKGSDKTEENEKLF